MTALRRSLSALVLPSLLVLTPAASVAADSGTQVHAGGDDGSHDFDFDFGTWKTHSSRLLHPLTGSRDWVEMDGITVVTKIWNARANLAEYRAAGRAGVVELQQIGRSQGANIVQEGTTDSGGLSRWSFTEIRPLAFRWTAEGSMDHGASWRLFVAVFARCTSP